MKNLGLFLLLGILLSFISCNNECHKHYYKVNKGLFEIDSLNIVNKQLNDFGSCKFNNLQKKYFLLDFDQSTRYRDSIWVYYYVVKEDTFVIPINDEIGRYHIPNTSKDRLNSFVGKGTYGCIPKFRKDNLGNLLFNTNQNQKILPLLLGNHQNIVANDSTILVLTPHDFKISNSDYDRLNSAFKENNFNLQGGIDSLDQTKMKIFKADDNELFTVKN